MRLWSYVKKGIWPHTMPSCRANVVMFTNDQWQKITLRLVYSPAKSVMGKKRENFFETCLQSCEICEGKKKRELLWDLSTVLRNLWWGGERIYLRLVYSPAKSAREKKREFLWDLSTVLRNLRGKKRENFFETCLQSYEICDGKKKFLWDLSTVLRNLRGKKERISLRLVYSPAKSAREKRENFFETCPQS